MKSWPFSMSWKTVAVFCSSPGCEFALLAKEKIRAVERKSKFLTF